MTPQSIAELEAYARKLAMQTLVTVNKKAFELARRDKDAPGASHRMTFGAYFFSAADDAQNPE